MAATTATTAAAAPAHTSTPDSPAPQDGERRDALTGRLLEAAMGAYDLYSIHLGERLGWYRDLAEGGEASAAELAARTGTHARYAREWLEQQAATGILTVDDAGAPADQRRYALPGGHREVLLDPESLWHFAPFARFLVSAPAVMPALLEAYRTGGGVPYAQYGPDARGALAAFNRPFFANVLASDWLPAIPDVHARLQAAPGARVADIGCGAGWLAIALARAYPQVRVDGVDADAPSIEVARENARAAGVADRVTFRVRDAADPALARDLGPYDAVVAFETIHDLAHPVEVLRTMRQLAAPGGAVIVADERTEDAFSAPGSDLDRLLYGASILFCLPTGMAGATPGRPAAGTGTVMRPATLRRYARAAGFRDIEILPIEHEFFRFYRPLP